MQFTRARAFFERSDWLAFWVGLFVSLWVYLLSLGPSIGLEDAGELATAANALGVPHPPGYPLWSMISWCFCRAFGWVSWQGHPNPAWAVSLASAVEGALAAGLTALLLARSGRDLLREGTSLPEPAARSAAWWGGVAGSLAFAFSPVMWSQAVIVEVYALGALFLALTLVLAYRWMRRPQGRVLIWLGLVFGLGLANYQVLLLAALPIALMVFARKRRLAWSFLALLIPLGLTIYLLSLADMESADVLSTPGAPVILRPESMANLPPGAFPAPRWIHLAAGALVAALAGLAPVRRAWAGRALLAPSVALAGLLLLLRLLYAADAPPEGFRGTLYAFWRAGLVHLAGLGALWALCWRFRRARRFALTATVGQLTAFCLLRQGLLVGLTHPTTGWFWWPVAWDALLTVLAWRLLPRGRVVAGTALAAQLGVSVYAYMPLVSDLLKPPMNWGYARTWEGFKNALARGQYEALTPSSVFSARYLAQLKEYWNDLCLQFSLPAVLASVAGTGALVWRSLRRRLRLNALWLLCTLLFFLAMSAVLIALANPTGDLQDGFIQKVKFIASHGVFALWAGYGVAALLALARRWPRALRLAAWACLAGVPLAPVAQNFLNRRLVRALGCAEQAGHDFGWQFGAHMLEGARAIRAELAPGEEPLPDPFWPPPMAPEAVYFGGTDPGRFVPTYMVFAAKFRPDIRVFTQNALAEPFYMSVQRDLYGDRLWLPTADALRNAFLNYVDDVQAGRRATRGSVTEVNGRMRISGNAAVMDLNEGLSREIFENNPGCDFYLEESYPVPWMDAFLEPAGLAMRLRRQGRDLDALAGRDADFWDWTCRRLALRRDYRRDFAAQKSFSKLRSASAGVYARNNRPKEAEAAFRQASVLYPVSSEVVFRRIQESLLPAYRFRDALRLIRAYRQADPNNLKAEQLEARVRALADAYALYSNLLRKVRAQTATTADVCELARACEDLALREAAADYWEQTAQAGDLTVQDALDGCFALMRFDRKAPAFALVKRLPEKVWGTLSESELLACAGLAHAQGDPRLALTLYQTAVTRFPKSPKVWLGVALYYYALGGDAAEANALRAMHEAIRLGGAPLITSSDTLYDVYRHLEQRFTPQEGATP